MISVRRATSKHYTRFVWLVWFKNVGEGFGIKIKYSGDMNAYINLNAFVEWYPTYFEHPSLINRFSQIKHQQTYITGLMGTQESPKLSFFLSNMIFRNNPRKQGDDQRCV